jgi:hypothetical protein
MAKVLLENSLKTKGNIYKKYKILESEGHISEISSSLETIIESSYKLSGFKSTLKIILSSLVDALWSEHENKLTPKTSLPNTAPVSISKKIKPSVSCKRLHKGRDSSFSGLKNFSNSMYADDIHLISEFCYGKGFTFNKQKRILGVPKDNIPGPADYNKNMSVSHPRSPSVTIPKTARIMKFPDPNTPAPGSYNPIKYYSSR